MLLPLQTELCLFLEAKVQPVRRGTQETVKGIQGGLREAPAAPGPTTLILLPTLQL